MDDIKDIRENINKVDDEIIKLLEERFDLSKKVRAYKIFLFKNHPWKNRLLWLPIFWKKPRRLR